MLPPGAYLIFGLCGTGKSTLGSHLRELGHIVIDTDEDDTLSGWYNIERQEQLRERPGFPLANEWINTHRWHWAEERFNELQATHAEQPVFFCGSADNINQFLNRFKHRFALSIDDDTMSKRLRHRGPERWNDTSPELTEMLNRNQHFRTSWSQQDNIIWLDATLPSPHLAASIINHITTHELTTH